MNGTTKGETMIYTTTATGEKSTFELDVMFDELTTMETKDAYGNTDPLLMANYWEAASNAWSAREISFGDGKSMARECRLKAAKCYRQHAEFLESL